MPAHEQQPSQGTAHPRPHPIHVAGSRREESELWFWEGFGVGYFGAGLDIPIADGALRSQWRRGARAAIRARAGEVT